MSRFSRGGRCTATLGLFVSLISTSVFAAEELTYIMLDDGSLRLSNNRIVSTSEYHAMPDGSLMLNDGTPLFEPMSSVSSEPATGSPAVPSLNTGALAAAVDHSGHNMNTDTTPGSSTSSHVHHHRGAGNFMFQYHFMHMNMQGLLNSTTDVAPSSAVVSGGEFQYSMAPTNMDMNMHMFMTMFGMTDNLTLMAMFNYVSNDMEMLDAASDYQYMKSEGMADTDISLVYNVSPKLITSLALSLPTGDINQRTDMMMGGSNVQVTMPYAMQLGSGTYDFKPSITYATSGTLSWGANAQYTWRMGTNSNGYTLGNKFDSDAWLKWALNRHSSVSVKLNLLNQGSISGRNEDIPATMSMSMGGGMPMTMATTPLADPANTGGTLVNWALGFSGTSRSGAINFNMAVGAPVYQAVNGVQMKNRLMVSSAVNWMF